jgi:hypothetical protein
MSTRLWRTAVPGLAIALLAIVLVPLTQTHAHEIVGNRFFPATLAIDDPGVNDELAVPTVSYFKNGDDPAAKQLDISGEYAKRITADFAVSFGADWTRLKPSWLPAVSGFQNIETLFKYRIYRSPEHEFVMSVGLGVEWGGTGAAAVGAERFNVYTPSFFFGKGMGDLPDTLSYARPIAVTGQIGYAIPARSKTLSLDSGDIDIELNPRVLQWGGSVQYSMPYLKSSVIDLDLPDFINHLIPIVEFSLETPVSNTLTSGTVTTGSVNPGVIWAGSYFQVGVEAIIPVNRQSGSGVGVLAQLHLYLDDIDPRGIGRPIFGSAPAPAKPFP